MAKLLVLEGIERCGKGTMQSMLKGEYGMAMMPGKKQPDNIPFEQLGILYEGMHNFAEKFYKMFTTDTTFIIDRYFLSEFVYAEKFGRTTFMDLDYVKGLCINNDVTMVYLRNEYQDYIDRGPKNKIKLTEQDYSEMQALFDKHIAKIKAHVYDKINIIEIDTHNKTIHEIYELITDKLHENQ